LQSSLIDTVKGGFETTCLTQDPVTNTQSYQCELAKQVAEHFPDLSEATASFALASDAAEVTADGPARGAGETFKTNE
jgi:hypothetical protein